VILPLLSRVILGGNESLLQRVKALLHTWMGACYAILLQEHAVDHVHAHHGYFGSWIAMVAARLLGVPYSLTLHGSDLLLRGVYLDVKLEHCAFCLTVSDYNRHYILGEFPEIAPAKVVVSRLGAKVQESVDISSSVEAPRKPGLSLLAVGRLHAVKDHAFLVRACARIRASGMDLECCIAGDGPERHHLKSLIQAHGLEDRVTLLGHVAREQMDSLYDRADIVVLTSRSEGIPLVLMEAMARGKIVLAPAITGIPELVVHGKTGFLYEDGSQCDFVSQLTFIAALVLGSRHRRRVSAPARQLDWIRHAAQVQVCHNFNGKKNLESFADLFVSRITPRTENLPHENFILQQI
jgi:glycosyltransferase involved in cell wall biosynthesis